MTTASKPNVSGGNYKAIDTKDGWYILRDVPCMSTVPKGVKNAPKDIGEEWMGDAVKFHQDLYDKGKTAFPIHISHNDDLGLTHPEFCGFFKPTRVGVGLVEGKEQPVTFSDWKIKKSAFDRMSKGELPFVSPEIRKWDKTKISSLALLDSQPPHFAFPLQTIGEVTEDPTATFSADLPSEFKVERFSDLMERVTFDPSVEEKSEPKTEIKESKMADAKKPAEDFQAGKPNANPVDQKAEEKAAAAALGAKMTMEDPAVAAKFAAMEDRNAALERRLNERDAVDKAKSLTEKALESLKGYQIGDKARAQIAKFAAEGEDRLNSFVETLKEVTPKDSPRTFAAAEAANAVPINDPALAKFAQQGPEKLEAAAKFASEYRTLKAHPAGKGMQISEDQYVKFQMDSAENPEGNHWAITVSKS